MKINYLIVASVFCVVTPTFAASQKLTPCKQGDFTLAQMISQSSQKQTFNRVPKDLYIDNKVYKYVFFTPINSYKLPVKSNEMFLTEFRPSLADQKIIPKASCRIRDAEGNWWLALQNGDEPIFFILQSDTSKPMDDNTDHPTEIEK